MRRERRVIHRDITIGSQGLKVERILIVVDCVCFGPVNDEDRAIVVVPHAAGEDGLAGEIFVAPVRGGDLGGIGARIPLRDIDAAVAGAFEVAGVEAVNVKRVMGLGGNDIGAVLGIVVCVSAWVGDERATVAVELEVQQIVMSMRAALGAGGEDNLAGAGAVVGAHDVVAGIGHGVIIATIAERRGR